MRLAIRREAGFTLIETLAALTVFSIMTVGLVPLLTSSVRGAAVSRSYTVGKNIATQAMEHVRGLPYHTSYASQSRKVDLLDFYYPSRTSNAAMGQTYEEPGIFTTVCNAATALQNTGCPKELPDDHSVTFRMRFVDVSNLGTAAWPDTYNYRWDPSSSNEQDTPPTRMAEMTITSSWVYGGQERNYELQTLLGDRRVSETRLGGRGRVDYGVQVVTAFDGLGAPRANLLSVIGNAESRTEVRQAATADQSIRTAYIRLVQEPIGAENPDVEQISTAEGATILLHAPPSSSPGGPSAPAQTVRHTKLFGSPEVAGIDVSHTSGLHVSAANELPAARGTFQFSASQNERDMWVHNTSTLNSTILKLHPSSKMFSVRPKGNQRFGGTTWAESGAVNTAQRRSETFASFNLFVARLFPLSQLPLVGAPGVAPDGVVQIEDFYAEARCKATANAATTTVSAFWRATIKYWEDSNPNGSLGGSYKTVTLDGTTPVQRSAASPGVDPLEGLIDNNPLVVDGPVANRIYLFETPTQKGYLRSFATNAPTSSIEAGGQVASAGVDGAITIDTAPSDPTLPESGLSISIGKLQCDAVDRR